MALCEEGGNAGLGGRREVFLRDGRNRGVPQGTPGIQRVGEGEEKEEGVEGFQGVAGVRGVRGVQEFRSSGVQEFRSSGVQEFRSSGVQEFRSSAWDRFQIARKSYSKSVRIILG